MQGEVMKKGYEVSAIAGIEDTEFQILQLTTKDGRLEIRGIRNVNVAKEPAKVLSEIIKACQLALTDIGSAIVAESYPDQDLRDPEPNMTWQNC